MLRKLFSGSQWVVLGVSSAVMAQAFAQSDGIPSVTDDDPSHAEALEHIEVVGRAQSLYRTDDGSLGTRTRTPLDQVPQSVQVIPESLIDDQAARQLTDLYRSVSGLSVYSYSSVTMRGFRQDEILYDGLRGDPFNGFAVPQLFNIQQVQVLKGSSGALYGSGEPGGIINYVTKKPTATAKRKLQLGLGNDQFVSGSLELSGPVTESADQRYRLGIYQDHENPYRYNTDVRNRIIDSGYAWDLGLDTTLTVQYTDIIQHYGGARLRGVPIDDRGNFLTSVRWNANEASDFQKLRAQVAQSELTHEVNDWLSTMVMVRYYHNVERQQYHEPRGLEDTNGDGVVDWSAREFRQQRRENRAWSATANATAELGDHTLLLGIDYYRQWQDFDAYKAREANGVPGLSLHHPQYGQTSVDDYDRFLSNNSYTRTERLGFFAQEQWQITDSWNVLAGARLDTFEDTSEDYLQDTDSRYRDHGWSYRLGSTYRINRQWHPYVTWATGFVPQDAGDQGSDRGGPFDPEESRLWEAGVRSYWLDNALNINVAAYHIVRKNILQSDPVDDERMIALGKVRSKGVEVDILGDLTARWVISASYAYNDTVVKDATSGVNNAIGRRFSNAPRHQFGLWNRYELPAWNSAIAFGADYVSEQLSRDGQRVKPYTIFDASWQTTWHDWQWQLNVKNLFNKTYAASGFIERTGAFPGEHRRVYLTASYSF